MKKIIPIAMRCDQEQFEAIKPKLKGMGIKSVTCFSDYPYLTNTDGNSDTISNINKDQFEHLWSRVKNIHETWNERIFLEACGIETFEITKETIIKYKMEDEFPEVFEVKLKTGKWYKRPHNKALFFIVSDPEFTPFEVYGFDISGDWMNVEKARTFPDFEIEATEQEVFEALKNEAVKRGYKIDVVIIDLYNGVTINQTTRISSNIFYWETIKAGNNYGQMALRDLDGNIIFHNGKWATILETKTKEEAEKLLGVKIID